MIRSMPQAMLFPVFWMATVTVSVLAPLASLAAPAKTVCTITINSSDEAEVFKKSLAPQGFKFVELVPESNRDSEWADGEFLAAERKENWLRKACESGVRCDVLVVSGHFGGAFFGSSTYSLSMDEIMGASCSNSCNGVFGQAQEVFLFGCNTLAGKNRDHRTDAEYVRVLVEDGFDPVQAQAIASLRYGPVGDSFGSQMEMAFPGAAKIYGFTSIGPAGSSVRPMLTKYFKSIRDYNGHLGRLDPHQPNKTLQKALQLTTLAETRGANGNKRKAVCELHQNDRNMKRRLEIIEAMLRSPSRLEYVRNIQAALKEFDPANLPADAVDPYRRIQQNREAREQFFDIVQDSGLSYASVAVSLLEVMARFSWISRVDAGSQQREILVRLLREPFSNVNRDVLCSMSRRRASIFNESSLPSFHYSPIRAQDLGREFWNDTDTRRIQSLECVDYLDPSVVLALLDKNAREPVAIAKFLLGSRKWSDAALTQFAGAMERMDDAVALGMIRPTQAATNEPMQMRFLKAWERVGTVDRLDNLFSNGFDGTWNDVTWGLTARNTLARLRSSPSRAVRLFAIRALAKSAGPETARREALELVRSSDRTDRFHGMEMLRAIGGVAPEELGLLTDLALANFDGFESSHIFFMLSNLKEQGRRDWPAFKLVLRSLEAEVLNPLMFQDPAEFLDLVYSGQPERTKALRESLKKLDPESGAAESIAHALKKY